MLNGATCFAYRGSISLKHISSTILSDPTMSTSGFIDPSDLDDAPASSVGTKRRRNDSDDEEEDKQPASDDDASDDEKKESSSGSAPMKDDEEQKRQPSKKKSKKEGKRAKKKSKQQHEQQHAQNSEMGIVVAQEQKLEALSDDLDFKVVIPSGGAARQFAEQVRNLSQSIKNLWMEVVESDVFSGILVESPAAGTSAFVVARFECLAQNHHPNRTQITPKENDALVCLCAATLNTCVSAIPSGWEITMVKRRGDNDVCITTRDVSCDDGEFVDEMRISTLAEDPSDDTLSPFKHKFNISMEIRTMKMLTRMAKDLKAEEIELSVLRPNISTGNTKHSFLRISIDGNAKVSGHSRFERDTKRPTVHQGPARQALQWAIFNRLPGDAHQGNGAQHRDFS